MSRTYLSKLQQMESHRTLAGAPDMRSAPQKRERADNLRQQEQFKLGGRPGRKLMTGAVRKNATAMRVHEQRKDVGCGWASQYHRPHSVREAKDRSWRALDVVVFAKKVQRAMARGWLRVCADRLPVAGMAPEVARRMMQMGIMCPGAAISRQNDEALDRARRELGMTNDNQSHGACAPGALEYAGWEEWRLYFVVCGWTLEEAGEILRLAGMEDRSLHRGGTEGAEVGRRAA